MHRLRAVRGRLPGEVHLRARRRQRPRATRPRPASGSASSTRSTTCVASTATCASRPAPPRRSPRPKLFEFSFTNRQDAIYTKAELLVDESGKPKQLPWEDWRDGEDANTSGWMRATSPSTVTPRSAASSAWSGERGYGVRAAEPATRRGGRVMEMLVFVLASAMVLAGAIGVIVRRQPRACRAFARAHVVRRRRALRRPRRPLPRRRAGDRLRRRDRRAVPVRDHAARRRQGRRPVDRAVPDPAPAGGGGRHRAGRARDRRHRPRPRPDRRGHAARLVRRRQHQAARRQPLPGLGVRVRVHVDPADRRRRRHGAAARARRSRTPTSKAGDE